ncbi:MAG: methyl-accepting chemotaxis protein [Planctomycetes bacterium]|nr:methyl-accepting chemotaxis protein [Planctomycetota bacterium]
MSLRTKILFSMLILTLLSVSIVVLVAYKVVSDGLNDINHDLQLAFKNTNAESISLIKEMNKSSAEDLLKEIEIAIGEALQPGETSKFQHIAKKQSILKQLEEFSFIGPQKFITLSSVDDVIGRKVADDIWEEGNKKGELVYREDDKSLYLYKPLLVSPDLARFRPDMQKGDMYGMLLVCFSKRRLKECIATQNHYMKSMNDKATVMIKKVTRTLLVYGSFILALVFVVTIILALYVSRQIGGQLIHTANGIIDIANTGNLTGRLKVKSQDELGKLTIHFNGMMEGFHNTVKDFNKSIKHLSSSSGNLMATSGRLSDHAGSLSAKTTTVAAESESLANNLQVVSNKAETVSESVNTVATAIEQMNSAMMDISKNISTSAQKTGETDSKAKTTGVIMKNLENATEKIGSIVKTIEAIADRTDLLALNATIEAATAGEAGKGFAVVANEIKGLSHQTQEATEEISLLINQVYNNTKEAVTSSSDISVIIAELNKNMQAIASSVEEVTMSIKEISFNMNSAAQSVDEINEKIQNSTRGVVTITSNINDVKGEGINTAEEAKNTNYASEELTQLAQNLKHSLDKFKI